MRFLLLICLLALASCASSPDTPEVRGYKNSIGQAQAHCLSKGYVRGTFDFDSCYRNRPEVQARERQGRLNTLEIIKENRSPRMARGRSYPVE